MKKASDYPLGFETPEDWAWHDNKMAELARSLSTMAQTNGGPGFVYTMRDGSALFSKMLDEMGAYVKAKRKAATVPSREV